MKTNLIYGLKDPRNDVYYYIGKTTIGKERPLNHLIRSHNKNISDWVNKLECLGLVPIIDIIEKDLSLDFLAEREKFWIEYYYQLNKDLFNVQLLSKNINKIRTQEDDDKFNYLVNLIFDIGNTLRNERICRRITQHELAKKANLSRSTISLCESGGNITVDAIKKYLAALKELNILTKNLDSIRVGKSHHKTVK
jgi:DNA-binding XRE family transcriptional regulator